LPLLFWKKEQEKQEKLGKAGKARKAAQANATIKIKKFWTR